MIKVLFVCHGNICRSPMAEFMFKKHVKDLGLEDQFYIDSKAVSNEEIGNDIYPLAARCLDSHNIPYCKRRAMRITKDDYDNFDYIFLMDDSNRRLIKYIIDDDPQNKISLFLNDRSIADPWYSGDFEKTYLDIKIGIEMFMNKLESQNKI